MQFHIFSLLFNLYRDKKMLLFLESLLSNSHFGISTSHEATMLFERFFYSEQCVSQSWFCLAYYACSANYDLLSKSHCQLRFNTMCESSIFPFLLKLFGTSSAALMQMTEWLPSLELRLTLF